MTINRERDRATSSDAQTLLTHVLEQHRHALVALAELADDDYGAEIQRVLVHCMEVNAAAIALFSQLDERISALELESRAARVRTALELEPTDDRKS